MARYTKKYILNEDIMHLPLSDDFKIRAARMGFHNIRQIIKTKQSDVEAREEYTVHWMIELSELAEQYGFLWELERDARLS